VPTLPRRAPNRGNGSPTHSVLPHQTPLARIRGGSTVDRPASSRRRDAKVVRGGPRLAVDQRPTASGASEPQNEAISGGGRSGRVQFRCEYAGTGTEGFEGDVEVERGEVQVHYRRSFHVPRCRSRNVLTRLSRSGMAPCVAMSREPAAKKVRVERTSTICRKVGPPIRDSSPRPRGRAWPPATGVSLVYGWLLKPE
jgi:hypothetical protein